MGYPTQTPRCADVFGALRNMDTYEVACDESNGGESACTDAAYDGTCRGMKMEGACGEAKTTLDILKCCDKNGNKAGSGCTNSRRRLAAAAPKRHPSNPPWVYEKDAEPCAKKCRTLGEGAPFSYTQVGLEGCTRRMPSLVRRSAARSARVL